MSCTETACFPVFLGKGLLGGRGFPSRQEAVYSRLWISICSPLAAQTSVCQSVFMTQR